MELIAIEKTDWEEIKHDLKIIKEVLQAHGVNSSPKKWITAKSAADYLNISVRTVYLYVEKNLLNPRKIRGILLFDRDEIEELIAKGAQPNIHKTK